jgi:UDP-glucose 4-epimerase
MKIAVTGGSGLLGTPVLRRLLADRKITEIRCLDLRPPLVPLGRVHFERADVRDPEIGRHLAGVDAVVHLAALVTALAPRAQMDAINVGGAENVFRAAAAAGVPQVVFTSSLAAYGLVPGHRVPLTEDAPRRRDPVLPYAMSKFDVEAFLDRFEREHPELKVVRLRPGVVLGERIENPLGAAMKLGLLPDVRVPMPAVWDEDVADAVYQAIARGAHGAYNLAAVPASAADVARATGLRLVALPAPALAVLGRAARLLGRRAPADPAWLQVLPDADMTASSERARRELGWTPRCPTTVSVFQRFVDVVPRRLDARLALFFRLAHLAARRTVLDEARHVVAHIHLALGGRRGGDVSVLVDHGRVAIRPGVAPRPPTSVVKIDAGRFLDLLAGRTDYGTAQLTGQVLVEGEPQGALIVAGLVTTFRARLGRFLSREATA